MHNAQDFICKAPSWSRLAGLFASGVFEKFFGYFFGVFGFIAGLRIKLIGEGDNLAQMIDGNLLLISGALFIFSGAAWKIIELLLFARIPEDISNYNSLPKYMDQVRRSLFNQEDFKAVYDENIDYWNKLNADARNFSRFFIVAGAVISLSLYLLSIGALLLSSHELISYLHCQVQSLGK